MVKKLLKIKSKIQLWMNSSLKKKLIILLLVFSIVPSLTITYLSYDRAARTMIEDKSIRAMQDMKLFIKLFELRLKDFEEISQDIVFLPEFKKDDFNTLTQSERLFRINQIENFLLKKMHSDEDINSIYLIGTEFKVVPSLIQESSDYLNEDLTSTNKEQYGFDGQWISRSNSEEIITYTQTVYDKGNFSFIALSIINIYSKSLELIYKDILGEYATEVVVFDEKGNLFFSRRSQEYNQSLYDIYFNQPNNFGEAGQYIEEDYIIFSKSTDTSFFYGLRVPVAHLKEEAIVLMTSVLMFLSIIIIFAIFFAISYAKQFVNPLNKMVETIRQNREGDFNSKIPIESSNEIGFLSQNYNLMIDEINQLIIDLDKQYYEKRKAEIDALQSQITPHFLYNTLNSIRCMARLKNEADIENAIKSTIELLQLTIRNREDLITIEDELAIVKNYMQLYAFRMNYTFKTNYHVEEELLKCKTIKFTIQPFIENAIHHGIDIQSANSQIDLNIFSQQECICIEIIDNGIGMNSSQIHDVLQGDSTRLKSKFNGIGVKNVIERIKMHFGEAYGVSYESEIGKGTKVTIVIPMKAEGVKSC